MPSLTKALRKLHLKRSSTDLGSEHDSSSPSSPARPGKTSYDDIDRNTGSAGVVGGAAAAAAAGAGSHPSNASTGSTSHAAGHDRTSSLSSTRSAISNSPRLNKDLPTMPTIPATPGTDVAVENENVDPMEADPHVVAAAAQGQQPRVIGEGTTAGLATEHVVDENALRRGGGNNKVVGTGAGNGTGTGTGVGEEAPQLPPISGLGGFKTGELSKRDDASRGFSTASQAQYGNQTRGLDQSNREFEELQGQQPIEANHSLASPPSLIPLHVPQASTKPQSASASNGGLARTTAPLSRNGAAPVPTVTQNQETFTGGIDPSVFASPNGITSKVVGEVNPAYVATHSISVGYGPAPSKDGSTVDDEAVHQAHVQKHLALLSPAIFNPPPTGARGLKPGRHGILHAAPPTSVASRDAALQQQRTALISSISSSKEYPQGDATNFAEGLVSGRDVKALEVDAEKTRVFESAGWKDKLGVLDTVDVGTTILEPVIQEHVQPTEHIIYTFVINREIHKYHIYPYIQPIHDPSPTIRPTRHLFPDPTLPPHPSGRPQYREVIGDEAAAQVLGRPLTRADTEGKTYWESWEDGVDGIFYEVRIKQLEDESVRVGRRGWVEKVGDRIWEDYVSETSRGTSRWTAEKSGWQFPGAKRLGDKSLGNILALDKGAALHTPVTANVPAQTASTNGKGRTGRGSATLNDKPAGSKYATTHSHQVLDDGNREREVITGRAV